MEDRTRTIRIESILGGQAPTTHFSREDQFLGSLGIDPSLPASDSYGGGSYSGALPSGLLRPVAFASRGTTAASPKWIIPNPKDELFYIYDAAGSVYTLTDRAVKADLGDLTDGGEASGNGSAYYDNYIYFARDTTVARYGPLNGTPSFTDDYWVSTLGKTALTKTTYPVDFDFGVSYPNHVMHRHSDGKLYIADVVGNQGTIHYIQTSKTTVEGDTDSGSTYSKISVGYGLWPTAIESYGSNLAISFIELITASGSRANKSTRAKIAFWDTTSQNINQITWVEFPDQMITAMKNINGVLYVVSGNQYAEGFRLSRFVGGYSFEEVASFDTGQPAFAGAIDGYSNRLLIGSFTFYPTSAGCVYSYGLQKNGLSDGIFNVGAVGDYVSANGNTIVTALCAGLQDDYQLNSISPVVGWGWPTSNSGIATQISNGTYGGEFNTVSPIFWSRLYNIGSPFKIKKIRIPIAYQGSNITVTPTIYTDDSYGTSYTLTPITNTSDVDTVAIRRSGSSGEVMTGKNNFWLELKWSNAGICTVGLPITIEYELLDD